MAAKCRNGSLTAAPVAGARGSYDSDDGHEGGQLGAAIARRGILDRGEHRQAAERAAADIEGHSEAAKFSEPARLIQTPRRNRSIDGGVVDPKGLGVPAPPSAPESAPPRRKCRGFISSAKRGRRRKA